MLDMLGDLEIQRLLVEGGPDTINRFLSSDLVNEFILVQSNLTHNEPVQVILTFQNSQKWNIRNGAMNPLRYTRDDLMNSNHLQ